MKKKVLFGSVLIVVLLTVMSFSSASSIQYKTGIVISFTHDVYLKYDEFCPANGEPIIPATLQASQESKVKLIQVSGPMTSDWIETRQDEGVVFLGFMQDYTYIVYLNNNDIEKILLNVPEVYWIGNYHPAYKIEEGLIDEDSIYDVNVQIWQYDFDSIQNNKNIVIDTVNSFGERSLAYDDYSYTLRATLSSEEIVELVHMDAVRWIDKYSPPRTTMNNVRIMTGADTVASEGGFDGTGVVGEVKDDGCDLDHPDFGNLIGTDGNVVIEAHGTCTFGIVFSDHAGDAKGMMYNGGGVFADWAVSRITSISNLKNTWGGVFQSNSWYQGFPNGEYNSYSQADDEAINTYDVSMLYAAGNSNDGVGPMTISKDSAAKNVICVGAVYHQNTADKSDDQWEHHGVGHTPSQGPAADGRIKPDLCSVFDAIHTTDVQGAGGYGTGDYINGFGGTSGATPIVAGGAGLAYQMYKENHFGNNPEGNFPSPSTIKAMLIANAYQYDLTKATRYQQGWGLVDVNQIYIAGSYQFIVNETNPLATGENKIYNIQLEEDSTSLKIVLCWTDKPGEASADKALINDLDLSVTTPDLTTYRGNVGLVDNLYSTPDGDFDRMNNVECVFIENPSMGEYIIDISGYNIALDNDPGDGVKQAYSLIVANCLSQNPRLEIKNVTGGLGKINAKIKNSGDFVANYVDYNISVTGGILGLINVTTEDSIPTLDIGEIEPINTDKFIFGLGRVDIVIEATYAHKWIGTGFIFGPFLFL